MNRDYLKEIGRKDCPIYGDRKLSGARTFLGYATRYELIVNNSMLKKFFKKCNNILYENEYCYMPDKIETIGDELYKIVLISKDLKKKIKTEKKEKNRKSKSKIEMNHNSITSTVTNGKQESKLIQIQKEDGIHFIHEQYENGKLIYKKEYIFEI